MMISLSLRDSVRPARCNRTLAGWVHTFAVSSSRRMSAPGDAAEGKPFAAEAALKAVVARKAMSRQWKAMTGDSVGNTMAVCRS